jgi:hypothetical protein
MDQRISGSAVDGAPTEEPRPDASNARSQQPVPEGSWCDSCSCLLFMSEPPWLPTGASTRRRAPVLIHAPSCAGRCINKSLYRQANPRRWGAPIYGASPPQRLFKSDRDHFSIPFHLQTSFGIPSLDEPDLMSNLVLRHYMDQTIHLIKPTQHHFHVAGTRRCQGSRSVVTDKRGHSFQQGKFICSHSHSKAHTISYLDTERQVPTRCGS